MLQVFYWHVRGLNCLLELLLVESGCVLLLGLRLVLALLFQDLRIAPLGRLGAGGRLGLAEKRLLGGARLAALGLVGLSWLLRRRLVALRLVSLLHLDATQVPLLSLTRCLLTARLGELCLPLPRRRPTLRLLRTWRYRGVSLVLWHEHHHLSVGCLLQIDRLALESLRQRLRLLAGFLRRLLQTRCVCVGVRG